MLDLPRFSQPGEVAFEADERAVDRGRLEVKDVLEVSPIGSQRWCGYRCRSKGRGFFLPSLRTLFIPCSKLPYIAEIVPNGDRAQVFFRAKRLFIVIEHDLTVCRYHWKCFSPHRCFLRKNISRHPINPFFRTLADIFPTVLSHGYPLLYLSRN